MTDMENKAAPEGPELIVKVLEGKAFYRNRFLEQIEALYPATGGRRFPRYVPMLYLRAALSRIPEEHHDDVCRTVARMLVDDVAECPTPKEVRTMIAAATLSCYGLDFKKLYERAKDFLAIPPTDQSIADRWIEQVIYTTVLRMGRDAFVSVADDQWAAAVAETILSDNVALTAYQVVAKDVITPAKLDYSKLLRRNDS